MRATSNMHVMRYVYYVSVKQYYIDDHSIQIKIYSFRLYNSLNDFSLVYKFGENKNLGIVFFL